MAKRGFIKGLVVSFLLLYGCGQELMLPGAGKNSAEDDDAADSGVTGQAGAPDAAVPAARLPVPDKASFTSFGGAGGEGGEGAGAMVPPASGSGGTPAAIGGRPASGGSKPSGDGGDAPVSGGAAGGGGAPRRGALLFSEYLEGSGSMKALELFSPDGTSLEGCELRTYFNGKLEPTRLGLHGSIPAGGFHVLCSSALAAAQPMACDRSTNLTFNGDDALALACDGVTLDVFGQIGSDPGDGWGDSATADHTLRRRCDIAVGRIDGAQPFEPAVEWSVWATDQFDDLGQLGCASTGGAGAGGEGGQPSVTP